MDARRVWPAVRTGAALLLSSLGTTVLSLSLAFGGYDAEVFFGYFRYLPILLLNWLPVLLMQTLLACLFTRHWTAFLLTAGPILLASVGNYFKILFRYEPFLFQDLDSIGAGLRVAGNYPLQLNGQMVAAALWLALGTPALALLVRDRVPGRHRLIGAALSLTAACCLWFGIYRSDGKFLNIALHNNVLGNLTVQQDSIATGFVYPFLHSMAQRPEQPPEGYDPEEAAAALACYADADIPEERAVSVLVLQLESFTDLEAMGFSGVAPEAYAVLRRLQSESISGTLVANVIGGGTIRTERCVLTGGCSMPLVTENCASYVRYFNDQGYFTTGSHPNRPDFYNRINVARYLGFSEYLFSHNHYSALTHDRWNCDDVFLPEVFRLFREQMEAGERVFSFNVSLQGHGPYQLDAVSRPGTWWLDESVSADTREKLNAYLSLAVETQELLWEQLEALRTDPNPAVVLIYGDHNPAFGFTRVYNECGLAYDLKQEDDFLRYFGTPYLIWANDAARAQLGSDFTGEGPTVSPGYLMNVLFDALGWQGSAYLQYVGGVMKSLPLISTNGAFVENGVFTDTLSPAGKALLLEYRCVQFYEQHLPVQEP